MQIDKEIEELVEKRDNLQDKAFKMRQAGRNTRARVTTMNARIGDVNDRIFTLREIAKNHEKRNP